MANDGALRAALLAAWEDRCAWCRRWIAVTETEVDHLVPQGVTGESLAGILTLHGLPHDYDVQATRNLVPSCRRCNRLKGAKPAPDAPIVALVIQKAASVAPRVDEHAAKLLTDRSVGRALALINAKFPHVGLTRETLDEMNEAASAAEAAIQTVTGVEVTLHPALGGLFNAGAWQIVGHYGTGVVTVTDGARVGYTGANNIMRCGHCGSHGPWNGARCLTCGMLDDGD
jgi:hypothetical protein